MISLRKASIADLSLLQYWDKQEHVIAADPDDDWNWEQELMRDPEWREQLIAEYCGRPIGVLQIIDPQLEDSHYWGEIAAGKRAIDIWIGEAEDLGKGYGTQMMEQALKICFVPEEVEEVLIDPLKSNKRAIRFYQRLGFTLVEDRDFGLADCAVHTMRRITWLERHTNP